MMRVLFLLPFLFVLHQKNTPERKDSGRIHIRFLHKAGAEDLTLNNTFTNSSGETFTVTRFRYYISNILINDSIASDTENYFLVDEENPDSKNISLNLEPVTCNSISFLLGVDSLKNVSGAQSGALDPMNGMFWTWNTGYIMAKLEGTSPASALPGHIFEYHIGGFKGENNVLKTITLNFPEPIVLKKDQNLTVTISADILQWFHDPQNLSIAKNSSCTTPGTLARQFADNYAGMFSIVSVNE